jgi:hypothetical protein
MGLKLPLIFQGLATTFKNIPSFSFEEEGLKTFQEFAIISFVAPWILLAFKTGSRAAPSTEQKSLSKKTSLTKTIFRKKELSCPEEEKSGKGRYYPTPNITTY